jgi:hypothetical protein
MIYQHFLPYICAFAPPIVISVETWFPSPEKTPEAVAKIRSDVSYNESASLNDISGPTSWMDRFFCGKPMVNPW